MGPPPRSFAADAHHCIMVRVSAPTEYKDVARSARHKRAPLDSVIPTTPSVPSCSEPSRYGPVRVARRANLDSPCARQRLGLVGRGEETGFRSNKETDEEKEKPLGAP